MKLWMRKLALAPLYLFVLAVDLLGTALGPLFRSKGPSSPRSTAGRGISVIIPERCNQPMLRRCLETLQPACAELGEPVQIIVVVSGSGSEAYEDLVRSFPATWIFQERPLWFADAIRCGLRAAKYGWVYLLNTDMELDRLALREVAKWRDPSVFAIASQIYFQDPDRRREETGWTAMKNVGGLVEIFDVTPGEASIVRGNLYGGGGSSLFQRDVLSRFVEKKDAYAPFYWEDVEWGVLAWRSGFEALFCPASKVWHAHRSTNLKFFSQDEIERIFRRNAIRFQLRTAVFPKSLRTVFGAIARLDAVSLKEVLSPSGIAGILSSRFRSYFDPLFGHRLDTVCEIYYGRPRAAGKPLVLVVSPYVVYPPMHGGARRIHELIDRLAEDFDIVLLSDEAEHYSADSLKYFGNCHAVYLVEGREETPGRHGRIDRILSHSRVVLQNQIHALTRIYDPDLVQIEYVELSKLIEARDKRPWILTLHDVLLNGSQDKPSKEDTFELRYINQFDSVITCSPEDRALLSRDHVHVVPNSADVAVPYMPSLPKAPLFFIGPFRYPPNLTGIIEFLETVYPVVRASVPEVQLWLLGGVDAPLIATEKMCFQQSGVRVFDYIEDIDPYLEACALTINPNKGAPGTALRGSALKVIESLAAGRVCVSTRDGARGLDDARLPSLVIADDHNFADHIIRLLTNVEYRHRIEVPSKALHEYSWHESSKKQAQIYKSLLRPGYSTRTYKFAQAGT